MYQRKFATMVGSRETPNTPDYPIGTLLGRAAHKLLYERGYDLGSGGAPGADMEAQKALGDDDAIRQLVEDHRFDLILPYKGFNGNKHGLLVTDPIIRNRCRQILIEQVYSRLGSVPRFISLSDSQIGDGPGQVKLTGKESFTREAFIRNVCQVLRRDLEGLTDFVICWTPDGCIDFSGYKQGVTGGTGIAILLAASYNRPVFNLERDDHRRRICDFVGMDYFERPKPAPEPGDTQIGLGF